MLRLIFYYNHAIIDCTFRWKYKIPIEVNKLKVAEVNKYGAC